MPPETATGRPWTFRERMSGPFDGLVRIDDARSLAMEIAAMGPWHLHEPAAGDHWQLVDGHHARDHLEGLLDEILREEKGVWTTMVYVQSRENPEVIKVFHPRRAGCGCGGGGGIVPWWVLSRGIEPETVPGWTKNVCEAPAVAKKSWLGKLFS
ncbi:MAG: hypothetical protein HQL76_00690 [Magnetococcales bacterium]|nr:hypothetical protein [Magnetococcales bacterium]